ncbi:hypothetical protein CspHIS471_0204010 [Cutaneotrichosporon sp. HIS471]|nr:hypothetical protein CspHIS471_0204010 [Cutaneotrichosporon sp. HIS471]
MTPTPTSSLFALSNRTILVTGGVRGLGLSVTVSLLESGADVVVFDLISPDHPDSVSDWTAAQAVASAHHTKLSWISLDVTDADAVSSSVNAAFSSARPTHPVKGLFNSAGIQFLKPATQIAPSMFRKVIDINLTGSFLMSAAFARSFTGSGGSVVLVASMSGRVANKGLDCAAYNASKAGVVQLARNLAMEWGDKIRVNTLSPGYIRTALTDVLLKQKPEYEKTWLDGSLLGRLSTVDEFRGPAIFLLSDASSFMTGADLVVDGGHTAV